jgi:hypothetical protein
MVRDRFDQYVPAELLQRSFALEILDFEATRSVVQRDVLGPQRES